MVVITCQSCHHTLTAADFARGSCEACGEKVPPNVVLESPLAQVLGQDRLENSLQSAIEKLEAVKAAQLPAIPTTQKNSSPNKGPSAACFYGVLLALIGVAVGGVTLWRVSWNHLFPADADITKLFFWEKEEGKLRYNGSKPIDPCRVLVTLGTYTPAQIAQYRNKEALWDRVSRIIAERNAKSRDNKLLREENDKLRQREHDSIFGDNPVLPSIETKEINGVVKPGDVLLLPKITDYNTEVIISIEGKQGRGTVKAALFQKGLTGSLSASKK